MLSDDQVAQFYEDSLTNSVNLTKCLKNLKPKDWKLAHIPNTAVQLVIDAQIANLTNHVELISQLTQNMSRANEGGTSLFGHLTTSRIRAQKFLTDKRKLQKLIRRTYLNTGISGDSKAEGDGSSEVEQPPPVNGQIPQTKDERARYVNQLKQAKKKSKPSEATASGPSQASEQPKPTAENPFFFVDTNPSSVKLPTQHSVPKTQSTEQEEQPEPVPTTESKKHRKRKSSSDASAGDDPVAKKHKSPEAIVPVVEFEDISADVDAEMKRKEEKRKKRETKEEKKRKRNPTDTTGPVTEAVDVPAAEAASPNALAMEERPKKKAKKSKKAEETTQETVADDTPQTTDAGTQANGGSKRMLQHGPDANTDPKTKKAKRHKKAA